MGCAIFRGVTSGRILNFPKLQFSPSLIALLVKKKSACNAADPSLIPGSRRSAGEGRGYPLQYSWASLVAQLVKNPPAVQETWVRSLGWQIPWRRERLSSPVSWRGEFHELYSPWCHKESDTTEQLSLSKHINCLRLS